LGEGWGEGLSVGPSQLRPSSPSLLQKEKGDQFIRAMLKLDIEEALTFDRHLIQAGFVKLS
jgi:hypothetical protein